MLTKPGKKLDSSESTHHTTSSNYPPLDIVHQTPQPRKEMQQKPLFDPKKMDNLIKPEPAGFTNHHRPNPSPKIPSSPGSNMTESQSNLNTKPNNNNSNNNSNMSSRSNSIESTKDKESMAAVDGGGKKNNNGAGGGCSTGGGDNKPNGDCNDPDYIDFEYF
ncbi:unnamed protein product [Arabidopsis thaliana]|uniref:(thale cress) hypothetical protein n=1 Tax=Arabidopsis thaliana TaxID=3702 RepID=A0A7G2E441_ARATH|nr:unnamed protein product [Arabidopsis thaliana]